jgi:hypothetical protein
MSNLAPKLSIDGSLYELSSVRSIIQANLSQITSYTELDGKFTIRFSSPNSAADLLEDLYCKMTTQSSASTPMYWHLQHAWWPLIRPMFCYSDGKELAKTQSSIRYLNIGSTDVDSFVGSFYKKINIDSIQGAPQILPNDTWILDKLTVTQKFEESVQGEIERYFDISKNYDDFNASQFIKEFLEMKSNFEVTINWSDNKSLTSQFDSYFI